LTKGTKCAIINTSREGKPTKPEREKNYEKDYH
jgi:hypothetical protein